jgi:Putative homoserine kinase type II (protein kinase fold)
MASDEQIREKLAYICKQFRIPGELILWRLIPTGHINTAYYVALYDGKEVRQFLVQKVNWYVFKDPVSMMHNIDLITKHIMDKERTLERRRRLHFHHTAEGNNYVILGEGENAEFWRLYNFIEHSVSFETADGNPEVLRMSGKAFGKFNRQLRDFDASLLVESIPHFHDTAYRMDTFFQIVEEDPIGRVKDAEEEIALIRENRDFAGTLCRQIERGELPIRVTHNDTKTNNILFDVDTLDPLVIIDLDTCMPGLACYDFGDTIRFAACTAEEDEKDCSRMKLDLELFRAYTEGYLSEATFLTDAELDSLATGAAVITLELASRFLGDYLVGDKYFRIDYPEHNLVRAKAQLALFRDMMLHMEDMRAIIREYRQI